MCTIVSVVALACDGPGEPDESAEPEEPVEAGGPAEAATPDPLHYVALGDSIAAGSAARTSYVEEYADWLRAETGASVRVDNTAVPGWTIEDLLPAVRDDEALRRDLATAHLITVNIGGNDLLAALRLLVEGRCGGDDGQACLRDAVRSLTGTWDDLLEELLEVTDGEVAGIRTMDVYRPDPLPVAGPLRDELLGYLDEVNDHLLATAEAAGIEVARVHEAFHGPRGQRDAAADGLLADDGIHPSDRGHRRIADALADRGLGRNDVD